MIPAHITQIDNNKVEQSLADHCRNTAKYARISLQDVGFGNLAYISGLLHDFGKGTLAFTQYIEKAFQGEEVRRGSVNHTFAGVIYVLNRYHEKHKIASEIIAYAIGAHHGLFDSISLDDMNGFAHRLEKDKVEICYEEAKQYFHEQVAKEEEIDELMIKASEEIEIFKTKIREKQIKDFATVHLAFLSRLILASVIYGDRKDTREFMLQKKDPCFDYDPKEDEVFLERVLSKFSSMTEIDQVRRDISNQCLKRASDETGIYELMVPTGGGKTLCSLRYSLRHAITHEKKRIFFVIPLLSILDQNADVIKRSIHNSKLVLEHHSNVIKEDDDGENLSQYQLLADTWDNPIIITTLVQLLNTMFSGKTSSVGRFRGLINSIIVIDMRKHK